MTDLGESDIKTHIVLVSGMVRKGKKYLLAKRSSSDPQAPGAWTFPGGKVDEDVGDSVVLKTLKKELLEEVGIEIKDKIELIFNGAFIRASGHHVVSLVFLVKYKSGVARPLDGQDEIKWMTLEEIMRNPDMPKYTLKVVETFNANGKILSSR